ncbi:hypothetical protein VTO42DRAFT_7160 [Malbranchea cinnamomea]
MSIPSDLPPRFEIRRLGPEHIDWANAIVLHSNGYSSPIWPVTYPDTVDENGNRSLTARLYKAFHGGNGYLMAHQVASGFSFGVFDKEYKFKREESKATGGKLYWNFDDLTATREQLLEQMDFPLVSVAMSFDLVNPLDFSQMQGMLEALPLFATIYGKLTEADRRGPLQNWGPKNAGEVLQRNATATREDYMDHKIMKKLAHWLMRKAASEGFKGIHIEAFHDAVIHTWLNPPAPFKAEHISEVNVKDLEEEVDGKLVKYDYVDQRCVRIFVTLKD